MRYEYHCYYCELTREVYHSIKVDPVVKCEVCDKVMTRDIGGGNGIIFKGTGFYETDYKRKKK